MIVVRFAPSPTGYLHVGGARTALFNYLFARRHGGRFILRIEDTDRKRYQQEALEEIFASLKWLGLEWDEGPGVDGPHGPYFQSERLELYHRHVHELVAAGKAYPCFCTEERLTRLREEQEKNKMAQGLGYDRHCRHLPEEEVQRLLAAKTPHVIRLKIPDNRTIAFHDQIRGPIEYQSDILDDIVLLKSDGFPTYHLANVIDDHTMEVTHVMRGDEWIASTPRHIILYEAFGWQPPVFAHMPVILSPDGGKLSKRKGAASVLDYQRAGFLPEALVNFLALLGWNPGDDREVMSREEMIAAFDLPRVSPKPAVFDEVKLEWFNGVYLQRGPAAAWVGLVLPHWREKGWVAADAAADDPYLEQVVGLLKDRSKRVNELAENARYFFVDPTEYEAQAAKKHFKAEAAALLRQLTTRLEPLGSFDHDALEAVYRACAEENGISAGKFIHPTRLAVSGVSFGPGLFEMMALIGKERVLRRMRAAADWITANVK